MAGLEICACGEWVPLAPRTRERFEVNGAQVFAPSLAELAHQLRLFGRPKDLRRAAALGG